MPSSGGWARRMELTEEGGVENKWYLKQFKFNVGGGVRYLSYANIEPSVKKLRRGG